MSAPRRPARRARAFTVPRTPAPDVGTTLRRRCYGCGSVVETARGPDALSACPFCHTPLPVLP